MKQKIGFYEFINRYCLLIAMFFSFCSTFGLAYSVKTDDITVFSNSIWSLLFFGIFTFIIYRAIKICNKRKLVVGILASAVLSVTLVFGKSLYLNDHVAFWPFLSLLKLLVAIGSLLFIFTSLFIILFHYLPKAQEFLLRLRIEKTSETFFRPNIKFFLIVWAIIMVCWLPTFLASYPGVCNSDAPWQIGQLMIDGRLNAHHPILHTLYLYGTVMLGNLVFGSYSAGLAIYSVTQMLMLSAVFAYACYYLTKLKAPVVITLLSIIYFALVPIHAIFSVSATKDVLFAAIVLLVVLFIIDMVRQKEKFYHSIFLMVRFVIAICFMMFLRNNGFYMLLLFVPFFIWFSKKYWIKAVILCVICIAANFLYTGPLYSVANVQKGDAREALSIPIQQVARAVRDNNGELTEEELSAVYELFDLEDVGQAYTPRISDPVKNYFDTEKLKSDMGKYVSMYFSIGFKKPQAYVDAFLSANIGSWYPDMNYPDPLAYHPYIAWDNYKWSDYFDTEENGFLWIERQSLFPALDKIYSGFTANALHQKIPVISMLFSPGFSFWCLIIFSAICIYYKRYRYLLPIVILFALWITILLSPVSLLRYSYPVMICIPILTGTVFTLSENHKDIKKELDKE